MKKRSPSERPRPLKSSAYAASPRAANCSAAQIMYPLCALNPWTSTITARGVPFGMHDRVKIFKPSAFLKDDSCMLPPSCSNDSHPVVRSGETAAAKRAVASLQPVLQFGRRVTEQRPGRGLVREPVQQTEIVDRAVVANGRGFHPGL